MIYEGMRTILEKTVAQLILYLLGPLAALVGLRLATGNWEWLKTLHAWVWILLAVSVLGIIWVRERLKALREKPLGFSVISVPPYGWTKIGDLSYKGVKWHVRVPTPGPLFRQPSSPSDVDVQTPPRCPKCETELEENRHLLWGFTWRCVGCGFRRHNQESIYTEVRRAERIAQRHYEKTGELDNV